MKALSTSVVAFVAVAGGCAVGPEYQPPAPPVPSTWIEAPVTTAEIAPWWDLFDDSVLRSLVDRAVAANLDLRIAEARVREARALRRLVTADRWPEAQTSASYAHTSRGEGAEQAPDDVAERGGVRTVRTGNLFRTSLDALWEIDLFGGVARSVEAAEADVDVAVEEQRATLVRLVGDVAARYVEVRSLQAELATTRKNLEAQHDTLDLTEARARAGLASDLDVDRARALVAATAADSPALEGSLRQAIHALGVLLGERPDHLLPELAAEAPIPQAPADVALGAPLDLLRRRPDIRTAERALAAATARIGEAEADLYPRLTLTGSVGFRSEDVQDLVAGRSLFSSIGPSVVWPVFDAGRIRANVDVQDARREQALARYEIAVRRALEEVENAWARYTREQKRRRSLETAVSANRDAVTLANRLYANGLTDFLVVLDAERSLLASERLLVRSDAAVSTNVVALYVALGGGWPTPEKP